jgi:spore coat polysaccharide biosynthesis protein SpsF
MLAALKIVAIVQARVASTRLPAKVLLDLGGKTALERCLARVARVPGISHVVVATTTKPEDDLIVRLAARIGVPCSRGSEFDVLSRYTQAARAHRADAVLRCTSDCPLIDPSVVGAVVRGFLEQAPDFASNTLRRCYPRGQDAELASMPALEQADREATLPPHREHVMPYVYENRARFRCLDTVPDDAPNLSHHRWTLDTIDDYQFLATVYDELGAGAGEASMADVLALLEKRPELAAINARVSQKTT